MWSMGNSEKWLGVAIGTPNELRRGKEGKEGRDDGGEEAREGKGL